MALPAGLPWQAVEGTQVSLCTAAVPQGMG